MLQNKQSPIVVHTYQWFTTTADSTIKCHNGCYRAIYFFSRLFLVRFNVTCWVSLDKDVIQHPMQDRMDPFSMEETAIYTVILEELFKVLGEIKPKYSRIFELLYHGYNSREIAETLGMPSSTIKDDIRKLRKIVRKRSI